MIVDNTAYFCQTNAPEARKGKFENGLVGAMAKTEFKGDGTLWPWNQQLVHVRWAVNEVRRDTLEVHKLERQSLLAK